MQPIGEAPLEHQPQKGDLKVKTNAINDSPTSNTNPQPEKLPSPTTNTKNYQLQDLSPNTETNFAELDSLLVYTKAVDIPTLKTILSEIRFKLRFIQLLLSTAAFVSLGYTAFETNYTTVILNAFGVSFFIFVSIVSMFVSCSNIFIYSFPALLDIPPHRHPRTSKVEVAFDLIMMSVWIIASSQMLIYAKCPSQDRTVGLAGAIIYIDNSISYCPTLVSTFSCGYLCAVVFAIQMVKGVKNSKSGGNVTKVGKHIMFARGSWRR